MDGLYGHDEGPTQSVPIAMLFCAARMFPPGHGPGQSGGPAMHQLFAYKALRVW